jgi:hypothetical protein
MTSASIDMRTKPTLTGRSALLKPVSVDDVPGLLDMLADREGNRLTGTHAEFDEETARRWYATRAEQDDRLDLAIVE